jgi:uncharacterized protein YjiS (DUF1127 family)
MTLIVHHTRPADGFLGRAAALVSSAAAAVAAAISREIDRRRTMQLLGCEDRMLADIGITRSDVYASLLTSAGEKASDRLARARRSRRDAERAQARETRGAHGGA